MMETIDEKGENKSPEKYDLSFSFDIDVENDDSADSETAGLEIDVSEVDGYDSSNRRNKRETVQDALVLNEMEEEIERQLDAKAAKTNLTATNVKNILKHVITNEHVMAMMQRRLNRNGDDDDLMFYEPKLTRAKAKELGPMAQPNFPWPVTPVKTASAEVQVLIDEELPEDSSDEEYKPDQDQQSDDEGEADNSVGSDVDSQPTTPATPGDNCTSLEQQSSMDIQYDSEGVFKIPGIPHVPTEEESIGQRTRSKLSLSETPLEYIEQGFIPPDITMDMYDHGCDMDEEWKNFLQDFTQPLPQEVNVEDDPEADPEYNVLEEDEADLLDKEELRMDKAVKVSRKEVDNLMDELLEYANSYATTQKQTESQELPKKKRSNEMTNMPIGNNSLNTSVELIPVLSKSELPEFVSVEQRQLLATQMRQHVQLMAQHFLMCYKHPDNHNFSKSCKSNIESLSYLSSGPHSAFNVENLPAAFKLIADWEEMHKDEKFREEYVTFVTEEMNRALESRKRRHFYDQKFHPHLEKLIIESKALSYPQLLPHIFSTSNLKTVKAPPYFNAEKNLIALGLEQFLPFVESTSRKKKLETLHDVVKLIRTYLTPVREQNPLVSYIRRIRNMPGNNPVQHYYKTGQAPRTIHYITLDFVLKSPLEQPIETLPERWQNYIKNMARLKKYSDPLKKKTVCQKLSEFNAEFNPGNHVRNPIVNVMPTVNLQTKRKKYTRKKSNPKTTTKINLSPFLEDIIIENVDTDSTVGNEALDIDNQTPRLPQLRKLTPRLAKTRSAQNIKSMIQVVSTKEVSSSAVKTKGKTTDSLKSSGASTSTSAKGDNEDEIAELMRASTTIKKNAASRKKAKQARELENIKRLIDSEKEINVEERATKFVASYLQKLHTTLESSDPETFKAVIKLLLENSEKLDNIIQTENEIELKTDEGKAGSSIEKRSKANEMQATKDSLTIDIYRGVCEKLENYPDLCSDFLLFLNSHQADMVDKSLEWMMLQKMQEFVHVAQVYFAKQPSRLAKVMQSLSQLAAAPNTPLRNVHETMGPVLKGSPLVMDLFLQVFPTGKPPESLFAPQLFENITCPVGPHDKNKVYGVDAPELYESIELPVSTTQEDPYGGENCKCNCHEGADPKLKTANEHCASCGTRYLNGRIYLQTSEGLRPAKITFPGENDEKLENIARVSLKTADKFIHTPPPPKRRRKSSKNDSEETTTKQQSTFKVSPIKEAAEEGIGDKLGTKSKRGPRSPPKTPQPSTSGIKKPSVPICKSKREKRAEKRDAQQEKKSQNTSSEISESSFELNTSQHFDEVPEQPSFKIENLTDEDEKNPSLDQINVSSDSESSTNDETDEPIEVKSWTRQEDAILLKSIKKEYSEKTFIAISEMLENRTIQQVKDRCNVLLSLLQKLA